VSKAMMGSQNITLRLMGLGVYPAVLRELLFGLVQKVTNSNALGSAMR